LLKRRKRGKSLPPEGDGILAGVDPVPRGEKANERCKGKGRSPFFGWGNGRVDAFPSRLLKKGRGREGAGTGFRSIRGLAYGVDGTPVGGGPVRQTAKDSGGPKKRQKGKRRLCLHSGEKEKICTLRGGCFVEKGWIRIKKERREEQRTPTAEARQGVPSLSADGGRAAKELKKKQGKETLPGTG